MTAVPYMGNDDALYSSRVVGLRAPVTPTLPLSNLTDDEAALIDQLTLDIHDKLWRLQLLDAYYRGEIFVKDLGISIPPEMTGLRTVLGWPRIAVDSLEERLDLEGFRFPDSSDVDEDLHSILQANDIESEQHLAHVDALVFGHSFVSVGSGNCGPGAGPDGCPPLISIESPLNMGCDWDPKARVARACLRLDGDDATLYLPDSTLYLVREPAGWVIIDRDDHNLGVPPVVRISNKARSYDRTGASEITPELMSATDRGARTMLGLEVAREFYSAPQRWIIGADESMFQDAQGNQLSPWQAYLGRVWGIPPGEEGAQVSVGQFAAYDPSAFTKVMETEAKIVSGITGLPSHVLGFVADSNPASADAIRSAENRHVKRAQRKCSTFGTGWRDVAKLALLIRDGDVRPDIHLLAPVWGNCATPTPGATTDAVFKQVQMGYLPATSDVTGESLGFDPAQRARIEADRKLDEGQAALAELASSLQAKQARTDISVQRDIASAPAGTRPPSSDSTGQQ